MASRKDPVADLAEKLVRVLEERRRLGPDVSPLSLKRVAELADATASAKTILAAVHPQRRAFSGRAVVARKDLNAPVALLDDLPHLAASPVLLEYLLESVRTAANQAATVADLKQKA